MSASRGGERPLGDEGFRRLAEDTGGIFWLVNWIEREILYVSPSWESVWGQSVDCLYSSHRQAWAENIHIEDRARVLAEFEARAEDGTYEIDFRVVHPDGSIRWLHERCFPIHDATGRVVRIAGVADDITARKRVEAELRVARDRSDARHRDQVAALTSELLFAEENARRQLAQELHDGMSQVITLALLKLAQLKDATSGGPARLALEIEGLVDQAGRACRSLTHQLSPPILHDLGFEPAIEWLCEEIEANHSLSVDLSPGAGEAPLDDRVRILLFRAVRELLLNVATHADAERAFVSLRREEDTLRIDVRDDGVALASEGERGLGLRGIEERLANLGGEMRAAPAAQVGTCITLIAPLDLRGDLSPDPRRTTTP